MSRRYEIDRRDLPRYGIKEAASYLNISYGTLNTWVRGRHYPTKRSGSKFFQPLIELPAPGFLSFFNLVEAHILLSTRKIHQVSLLAVREAIDYVATEFPSKHPLLSEEFLTDGKDLFVNKLEKIINVSRRGQLGIRPILDLYLKRIERDRSNLPMRLFPIRIDWVSTPKKEPAKVVVIDPRISSGRPVIYGTGVIASILAGRFRAGEGIEELAQDYGVEITKIEEVIRYVPAA